MTSPFRLSEFGGALREHLLPIYVGLLKEAGRLIVRPGAVVKDSLAATDRVFARPVQLFLVANLLFFIIGPSVGLMNFTLDSLGQIEPYAEAVRGQIQRLGVEASVYRERFNGNYQFRQPTFLVILVVPLALWSKALAWRRLAGEHLVVVLLFMAWLLFAWPVLRLTSLGLGNLGLSGMLPELLATFVPSILATVSVGSVLYPKKKLGAAAYGVGMLVGVLAALGLYGHVIFWLTFGLLEIGL